VPLKTNAPLVIDTDTVLTCAIPLELFQLVCRWNEQITDRYGTVQHSQLSQGNLLDGGRKLARTLAVRNLLSFFALEGSYYR